MKQQPGCISALYVGVELTLVFESEMLKAVRISTSPSLLFLKQVLISEVKLSTASLPLATLYGLGKAP